MDEQPKTLQLSPNPDPHHHHRILLYGLGALLLIVIALCVGYLLASNNSQIIQLRKSSLPVSTPSIVVSPTTFTNANQTQSTDMSSLPQNIKNTKIAYDDGTNVYLMDGLSKPAKLIDQGHNPLFSPDHTKIAYIHDTSSPTPSRYETNSTTSQIMIYDMQAATKTVLTTGDQNINIRALLWSPGGSYLLTGESSPGSDIGTATIYAFPSGVKKTTVNLPEGTTIGVDHWVDDSTLIYTDRIDTTTSHIIYNQRCAGAGYVYQIVKMTLPSTQKQIILPATKQSDYISLDFKDGYLYYRQQDSKGDCTQTTLESYWKSTSNGTSATQITQSDLPKDSVLLQLQSKYPPGMGIVSTIQHNASDNKWVLFSLSLPKNQGLGVTYSSIVALLNTQDQKSTIIQIGKGMNPTW